MGIGMEKKQNARDNAYTRNLKRGKIGIKTVLLKI